MSGMHRDESYHPIKTRTIVLWFFALFTTIVAGLSVGDSISVYAQPFAPLPIFHSPEVRDWLDGGFPDVEDEEPATATAPADSEPDPVISSSPSAVPTTVAAVPTPTGAAPRTTPPVRTAIVVVPPDILVGTPPVPAPVTDTPVVTDPVVTTPDPVIPEPIVDEEPLTVIPEENVGDIVIGPYGETCEVVDDAGNKNCNLPDISGTPPIDSGA